MHLTPYALGALSASQNPLFLSNHRFCSEITIPVSVSSNNAYIDPGTTSHDSLKHTLRNLILGLDNLVFNVKVEKQYKIAARYCEPEVRNSSRANTIQFLTHGITYTRDYWSGLGPPGSGYDGDKYSWIAYASKQGYPTLSIDRLGNGQSDRPDGITDVQINTQVEVAQSIINSLRSGEIGGRAFDKVIYVGHSYGSLIGNLHSVKYPESVDAYMLTGFTKKIKPSVSSIALKGEFLPAAIAYPERWLGQSVSYFTPSDEKGTKKLFFTSKTSDPELVQLNFMLRGTVTAGEFVTTYECTQTAPDYRGRIFVLTGEKDAIFCSPGELGEGTLAGIGNCKIHGNLLEKTRKLYPAAANYDYYSPPNIGHCNILHQNAPEQFAVAHNWLSNFF